MRFTSPAIQIAFRSGDTNRPRSKSHFVDRPRFKSRFVMAIQIARDPNRFNKDQRRNTFKRRGGSTASTSSEAPRSSGRSGGSGTPGTCGTTRGEAQSDCTMCKRPPPKVHCHRERAKNGAKLAMRSATACLSRANRKE